MLTASQQLTVDGSSNAREEKQGAKHAERAEIVCRVPAKQTQYTNQYTNTHTVCLHEFDCKLMLLLASTVSDAMKKSYYHPRHHSEKKVYYRPIC